MTAIARLKPKTQEKILVWDKPNETRLLIQLLHKHIIPGFDVEYKSFGATDDYPECMLNPKSDYDIIPVICEDDITEDRKWFAPVFAYRDLTSFSDFGAVLARLSHANVAYVFPRLHITQQRKPDVAVFFYTDDKAELKKPLERERFKWISKCVDALDSYGILHTRAQIETMIKDGTFFERIREHHFATRVRIIESDPVKAAKYEGIMLGKGKRSPSVGHLPYDTEALERLRGYGMVVANMTIGWETFAHTVQRVSPGTLLVFYSGDASTLPIGLGETLYQRMADEAGLNARFLAGNLERLLQYDAIERVAQREDLRRDFKKAGVFDSLKRLEAERPQEDKVFYDLKQRIQKSK